MKRIYLDYAAATPVADEVLESMEPYLSDKFGNAGALHSFGQEASSAIDNSREVIADELGAKFKEVIFTGSATEANNLLIRGVVNSSGIKKPRIIISGIEHESVFEVAEEIKSIGIDVIVIPVSSGGIIDVKRLQESLSENTICVSVIYASNVIGVVQPIGEIGEIIKNFRGKNGSIYPLFHTDAAQAFQFFRLKVADLGVDSLTLSGQKIYGPKGVGALFLSEGWRGRISPLIRGGSQEFGLRAGTSNTPAIVGFAKAVEYISGERESEAERIGKLRDYLWQRLRGSFQGVELNGSETKRLPNNLNIYFPRVDSQEALVKLDKCGIAVSIGSACSARARRPSRVVSALGLGAGRAESSIRITLGRPTTMEEIEDSADRINKCLNK